MKAERFYWAVAWVLAIAVIVTHVLGAGPLGPTLWGANLYGFLPRAALIEASALLAMGLVLVIGRSAGLDRALRAFLPRIAPESRGAPIRALVAMVVGFLAFWLLREGHTFLGDGGPLTQDLPLGNRFHPYEPLTYLFHHWFYGIARGLFDAGGKAPADVAHATVGLSSAIAGALFIPLAWGLARELARSLAPDPADAPATTSALVVPLAFLLILAQGYVQLFFGYVENYTLVALALAFYFYASLRHLRGGAPLALPGVALVLLLGMAVSNVILVPSFLFLFGRALALPSHRRSALRDLIVVGLAGVGITVLMGRIEPGYSLASAIQGVVVQALFGEQGSGLGYMFSGVHIRDFLNEQMLIGPAAAFLLVAGLLWLVIARARLNAAGAFCLIVGVVSLGAAWVTTDLKLGFPRDWDLFAPLGLAFTIAGLHVLLSAPWSGAGVRRWLVLMALISLFHTAPWVAVNASFDRSFARFKTLPLEFGRTEAVVGMWYLTHEDTAQAIPWLRKSLHAYPGNNIAAFALGNIGMKRGMYRWAAQGFWTALRSRPDKENYRFALVQAILRGGGPPEMAIAHLDTLLARHPDDPVYWAASGIAHLGIGEREPAAVAFERAMKLAPQDSSLRVLMQRLDEPDGYARAIREDWPAIAGD